MPVSVRLYSVARCVVATYEENHFLRGDRTLQLGDVRLAKLYGPLLVLVAQNNKPKSFRQFLNLAKHNFNNEGLVQDAIPLHLGRKFEAFRLYLRFYDLPDPSAWITDRNEQNSNKYTADFNLERERKASATWDWTPYVPKSKSLRGVKVYTQFFTSLECFARPNNKQRTGLDLRKHLAKYHIRQVLDDNIHTMSTAQVAKLNGLRRVQVADWIDRVVAGEKFEEILDGLL